MQEIDSSYPITLIFVKKAFLLSIVLISCFSSIYANMRCQLSTGMDIYSTSLGYNVNLSVHYPLRLLNRNNDDFNPGLMLSGSYANLRGLNILNYGAGMDLGYIVPLSSSIQVIPSAGLGWLWGNITVDNLPVAEFNNIYMYPHFMTAIDLTPAINCGIDIGYMIRYINHNSSLPDTINGIVLNITFTIGIPDNKSDSSSHKSLPSSQALTNLLQSGTNGMENEIVSEVEVIKNSKSLVSSGNKEKAIELLEAFLMKNPDNKRIKELLILLKSTNVDIINYR